MSGQVSLNFGHKLGWSYLTVGAGPLAFESYKEVSATAPTAATMPDGLRARTVNFGGGARWFNVAHLAFTVDLRFYLTPAALATPNTAPRDKHKVFVMSAGIAIK